MRWVGGVTGSRLGVKVERGWEWASAAVGVQQLLEAMHYAAALGRPSEMERAG